MGNPWRSGFADGVPRPSRVNGVPTEVIRPLFKLGFGMFWHVLAMHEIGPFQKIQEFHEKADL